ncbi:MAG: hypothetical protein DDT20_01033 [Firmicutes bacterium]|nr:hypothetical protein [Bacillota bacterium]
MRVAPLTLADANDYITEYHRHHKRVQGHRFSLAAISGNAVVGIAVVGRPVARGCNPYMTAEVTRLCTDGTKNACSFLYAACARVCKAMGFSKIQTYILVSESGTTLKAAGWKKEATTQGGDWNHSKAYAGKRRVDQPQEPKQRWAKDLI